MTEQDDVPSSPSPEEVEMGDKITSLGNQIKDAKAAGQSKEEWDPLLKEMLSLKVRRMKRRLVRMYNEDKTPVSKTNLSVF